MNIRTVTCFVNAGAGAVEAAGRLAAESRSALEAAGLPVQTTRLATQPLSRLGSDPLHWAATLWPACQAAGFEYLSLGPVEALAGRDLEMLDRLPELIRQTETVFAGVLLSAPGAGLNLAAVQRTAEVVRDIAHSTPQGFGNLRLAALANVGPHAPFFPAAYHDGGPPAVAVATESADLAVEAFSTAGSLAAVEQRLVTAIESAAARITAAMAPLAARHGFRFAGIDFSLAPFPEEARSIGTAVERLGVDRFGAPGTLFAAALLTGCLRRARYPRCGFNGLMLPLLEDATLAARSQEGLLTVNDLLLYSAVCGTGLDTVPLPGDVGTDELAGILLDVVAMAARLDKPLTARLMPVPGLRAGDVTGFEFAYFRNGRVLDVKGYGSSRLLARAEG